MEYLKIREIEKHKQNPFVDTLVIKKGKSTVIAGSTNKIMVDNDTGEVEGITLVHRYKEVDKENFIKLYLGEVRNLFELSRTGIKAFTYVLSCLRINDDEIYINIAEMCTYCDWTTTTQAYRGLGELIHNKIIAPSKRTNIWFINPHVIFNGNRIAFVKEYKLNKTEKIEPKDIQSEMSW